MNILDATQEFMERAHQLDALPTLKDFDLRELRRTMLDEEIDEYFTAEFANDQVEMLDGLLDIIVIAWGTALAYFGPEKAKAAAAEVVRSNLDKVDGPGLPIMREDGKVLKPKGWRGPDIAGVLNS